MDGLEEGKDSQKYTAWSCGLADTSPCCSDSGGREGHSGDGSQVDGVYVYLPEFSSYLRDFTRYLSVIGF